MVVPSNLQDDPVRARYDPAVFRRFLDPRAVAIVGISENSLTADCVLPTLQSSVRVHFINPKYPSVYSQPTLPSLEDVPEPVDAVMSFMSAPRTVEMVEGAAALNVGGYVLMPSGFAEIGSEGQKLQQRLSDAVRAQGVPAIGPNGLGYVDVRRGVRLTMAAPYAYRPGGTSIVSHSGAAVSAAALAITRNRGTGLHRLISAGNEAVCDMADFLYFLATDDETKAIGLIIEKIRRPAAFFAAVASCTDAGKPIVAIKLARTERSQRIAHSHTGALTGDAWIYEVALRQAGVALARDFEEMADRLQFFDQIPPDRRTNVDGLGFLTQTGGLAGLAADVADEEAVVLPGLDDELGTWVKEHVPGGDVANPLDPTGLVTVGWAEILKEYSRSSQLDALMMCLPFETEDERPNGLTAAEFCRAASESRRPFVISSLVNPPAEWVDQLDGRAEVALGNGLRSSLRGLRTLGAFSRYQEKKVPSWFARQAAGVSSPTEPRHGPEGGQRLSFEVAMTLLSTSGIPVAPYRIIGEEDDPADRLPFDGPFVAKLAEAPHRTEIGGVLLRLSREELADGVLRLRAVADRHHLPGGVVVQPMLVSQGEAFLGLRGDTELGPLVVFGLGGVLVEAIKLYGGRMAPVRPDEAGELIDEMNRGGILDGVRGSSPWDRCALSEILVAAGNLAAGSRSWMSSLDINPLVFDGTRFVAVDALCLVR